MFKATAHKKEPEPDNTYPKLMISFSGTIVLFSDRGKGVCLASGESGESGGSNARIGEVTSSWHTSNFKDYNGTVVLENI